jgi:ubiquinone/menaquinone biosynthesis C-methylase UbiE
MLRQWAKCVPEPARGDSAKISHRWCTELQNCIRISQTLQITLRSEIVDNSGLTSMERPTPSVRRRVKQLQHGARRRVRRFAEFRGIRRQPLSQYQSSVRRLYDGPRGAALKFSSLLSLHEPLMGQLFRSGRFDAGRFKTVLDVGSGAGQIIRHLLDACGQQTQIIGFDLSAEMLRRAKDRLKSDRPFFVAADMMHMPFRDDSFDCVTCGYVLEHLPDPEPGLAEFARVLKPGGTVLLLATEDSFSGFLTSHTWKCRTFNRAELRSVCDGVGLRWSREHWFTPFHQWLKLGGILVELQKAEAA